MYLRSEAAKRMGRKLGVSQNDRCLDSHGDYMRYSLNSEYAPESPL